MMSGDEKKKSPWLFVSRMARTLVLATVCGVAFAAAMQPSCPCGEPCEGGICQSDGVTCAMNVLLPNCTNSSAALPVHQGVAGSPDQPRGALSKLPAPPAPPPLPWAMAPPTPTLAPASPAELRTRAAELAAEAELLASTAAELKEAARVGMVRVETAVNNATNAVQAAEDADRAAAASPSEETAELAEQATQAAAASIEAVKAALAEAEPLAKKADAAKKEAATAKAAAEAAAEAADAAERPQAAMPKQTTTAWMRRADVSTGVGFTLGVGLGAGLSFACGRRGTPQIRRVRPSLPLGSRAASVGPNSA